MTESNWKFHGVRVVKASELDANTAQTPGMSRSAAITNARCGAEKLWAGTVVIHPSAKTGAHHHGPVESVIYVVSGKARMRWGDNLEFIAEAGPGDFIHVPPYVPHQEINASETDPLSCVLCRSGQEPVVVNLDIPMLGNPYPDSVIAKGMVGTFGIVRPTIPVPQPLLKDKIPVYSLNIEEIDELVSLFFEIAHLNPHFYIKVEAAREILKDRNKHPFPDP